MITTPGSASHQTKCTVIKEPALAQLLKVVTLLAIDVGVKSSLICELRRGTLLHHKKSRKIWHPPFCRAKRITATRYCWDISSDIMGSIGSSYFQSLDYSAQKRYLTKLKVDGHDLKDPYDIPDDL